MQNIFFHISDLHSIKEDIKKGMVLILRVTPLAQKDVEKLRNVVEELYTIARNADADIARLIVFEMVTRDVAKIITESVKVPTIGIGSGKNCDGQVLVVHDMLGMFEKIKPKFAKRYLNLSEDIRNAINSYVKDVKEGRFPEQEHTFSMEKDELEKLEKKIV